MSMVAKRMEQVRSDIRGPLYLEALRMEAAGEQVLKLNTGNPGIFGFGMPDSFREALAKDADKAIPYCDLRGMQPAREALLQYHQKKGIQGIGMEDIFIGNGVSELAQMLLTAVLNPGDEILLPAPCYALWSNGALTVGAVPVFYRCNEQAGWYPDPAEVRALITPRTKALLIINPNNPTGVLYPQELVSQLMDIAREHRLLVFSDEIYDRLVLDGKEHVSSAALATDVPVVTLNGLSKSHNVCGFRCGWMVLSGPKALTKPLNAALATLASIRLCGNALTQLVIPAALEDPLFTQDMLAPGGRLYEQREVTTQVLGQVPGVSFVKNSAAFYLFPKLDTQLFGITDDRQFCLDLLHHTKVLVIPGSGFEWPEPDHVRIVMLPQKDILRAAMERVGEYLLERAKR